VHSDRLVQQGYVEHVGRDMMAKSAKGWNGKQGNAVPWDEEEKE
jgi:hypothetical protein